MIDKPVIHEAIVSGALDDYDNGDYDPVVSVIIRTEFREFEIIAAHGLSIEIQEKEKEEE